MSRKTRTVVDQVYRLPEITDASNELFKRSSELWNRNKCEAEEKSKVREENKVIRIRTSDEDKYSHALGLIIEYALAASSPNNIQSGNNPNNASIAYYYFNFDSSLKERFLFDGFLSRLKEKGCFESFETFSDASGLVYWFKGLYSKKLKKYKQEELHQPRYSKKNLTDLIKLLDLSLKKSKLIRLLGDGDEHGVKSLMGDLGKSGFYQLISETNELLAKKDWHIKCNKSPGFGIETTYQLIKNIS